MGELTVAGSAPLFLAVVSVAPGGGRDRWAHGYACAGQNPGALAGGEARRQQPVVDLPRHGDAVECSCRDEQAGVVREAVRCRVDVAFDGIVSAVERRRSLIDIQEDFIGETAGD